MSEYREGQTATHPRTGQKVVFKNGQWVNAGTSTPPRGIFGSSGSKSQIAADARQQNLTALSKQYAEVARLYERDLKGVGPGSLLEYLPLPRNRAFDKAATGLSEVAMAAFRVPGVGAQSDADAARMAAAFQPQASDSDEEIEAKLRTLRNRLETAGVKIPGERAGQFKVIR